MSEIDKLADFQREAALYFRNRPTNGEDAAHWANVYNAENCEKTAKALETQAAEIERLREALEGANQRAATAEHRLYSFRQHRAARAQTMNDFIKQRAPELWPDYAAVSVNGSLYSEDCTIEPTYEREMNTLLYRAEKAEQEVTNLREALKEASHEEV